MMMGIMDDVCVIGLVKYDASCALKSEVIGGSAERSGVNL